MDVTKYSVGYCPPKEITCDWVKKDHIEKAVCGVLEAGCREMGQHITDRLRGHVS